MKHAYLLIILSFFTLSVFSQSYDLVSQPGKDLDLKAVLAEFSKSKSIEDFERRLNDPRKKLSNLDLNGDGLVDYLRVIENFDSLGHILVIQAVIGPDLFQDVATLDLAENNNKKAQVQVVGDPYVFGNSYIVEAFFDMLPYLWQVIWDLDHQSWCSPYYWGYYPGYYEPFPVCGWSQYQEHVTLYYVNYITIRNVYVRRNTHCGFLYRPIKRRDIAEGTVALPDRSKKETPRQNETETKKSKGTEEVGQANGIASKPEADPYDELLEKGEKDAYEKPSKPSRNSYSPPVNHQTRPDSKPEKSYESPSRSLNRSNKPEPKPARTFESKPRQESRPKPSFTKPQPPPKAVQTRPTPSPKAVSKPASKPVNRSGPRLNTKPQGSGTKKGGVNPF